MNMEKKIAKIVIMGLENSGKTSILLSLQQKVNLLTYYSLKPTPGVDIVTIDKNDIRFVIWECGGQEQYRKEYLQNLEKYVQQSKKFIYVIDVQDIDRYEAALKYFSDIIRLMKKEDIKNMQLSIFLHKFDPGLEKDPRFSYKKISTRLINKISNIIPPDINYYIFKTTIYTVFEKKLLESVSDEIFTIL
ncbi:MAG: ADP-ribosylation factor-like protein [Candidatus Helarchaeota archaeon]